MAEDFTHFGFRRIPVADKARQVADVFHRVAGKYDLMNDIMSLGSHRVMKRLAVELARLREGHRVLDLAGGTGDLTRLMAPLVGATGTVILCDINPSMVAEGRRRLIDQGMVQNVEYLIGDAEALPLPGESVDAITMAFGLRNVTDQMAALASMHRVLKAGGRLVVLEFSRPSQPLVQTAFDTYSSIWPDIGRRLLNDADSYRYLIESIKMHPDQETLKQMMTDAGFSNCEYHNLMGGIAAIHVGSKSD